jgi:hypothetical protein
MKEGFWNKADGSGDRSAGLTDIDVLNDTGDALGH